MADEKNTLRGLDEKISDIMGDECEGDECIQEANKPESILMELSGVLAEIEEKLELDAVLRQQSPMDNLSVSGSSSTKKVKAKLPKLELITFSGKPQYWPEFWDAFSSVIGQDEDLPEAVNFQYLKSLLQPASSVISGFKITVSNYRAAAGLYISAMPNP